MKRLIPLLLIFFVTIAQAQESVTNLDLPDSVRAIQLYAEVMINSAGGKEAAAGIRTDVVTLAFEADKIDRSFVFEFSKSSKVVAKGSGVEEEDDELEWNYNWDFNKTYRLLIAVATDSAENFSLYSGYIGLPDENKWKLIGTCRVDGRWTTIKAPATFQTTGNRNNMGMTIQSVWIQRNSGSWKTLSTPDRVPPLVNVTSHTDSATRHAEEISIIEKAIAEGKTDARLNKDGVYYSILSEGTGRQVSIEDTVVVHYKGYLFSNGEVFDQTKETAARFPLKRLIRGWQIALPLVKTGGRIKIVIPSHLAYSIRTRAAKIPPNSILVFEVEIL